MGDGGFAHVVIHFVVGGGFQDVLAGLIGLSQRFEVEAEVKVGVAEVIAAARAVVAFTGGAEHGFDAALACKEVVHLAHRHAGIASDGDQGLARGFHALETSDAEEVPRGVFDVGRVHGLVDLELLAPVLETLGVVKRQPTLPELRFGLGDKFDDLIEGGHGVGDAGFEEGFHTGFHPLIGGFFRGRAGNDQQQSEQAGQGAGHGDKETHRTAVDLPRKSPVNPRI